VYVSPSTTSRRSACNKPRSILACICSVEQRYPFASAVNDGGKLFPLVHQPLKPGVYRDAFGLGRGFQARFVGARDLNTHNGFRLMFTSLVHAASVPLSRSNCRVPEPRALATGTDRWVFWEPVEAGDGRAGWLRFCVPPGSTSRSLTLAVLGTRGQPREEMGAR
jgi:hypothetical protein